MTLSIAAQTFTTYQGNAHSAVLRIYCNQNFEDTDSIMHSSGSIGSNSYFFSSGCTITNGVVNVPQVDHPLPITTDIETTIFTAGVYTRNGQLILTVLPNYRLDANLAPSTTWEAIKLFSTENNIRISGDVYTKQQVDELLSNISVNIVTLANTYSNSLATAITAIGSTPTTLVVDENTSVSTSLTVPSTFILDMRSEALISKSGSGAIAFQGVGLVDPESVVPVFSGFAAGDITWTGTTADKLPKAISTELWNTGNTSLSDRLNRADKAFGSQYIKIVCHPRTITTTVDLSANRQIYFSDGDYANTYTTGGGFACFQFQDNTVFTGTQNARLHEAVGQYAQRIIGPYQDDTLGSFTNIRVEGLTFKGDASATGDEVSSTVILGNAKDSWVRGCVFDGVHAFATTIGGVGTNNHYAENCDVTNNQYLGVKIQVIAIINAKNLRIVDNHFDQKMVNDATIGTYDIIDVEPNATSDYVDGLVIANNTFDCNDPSGATILYAITINAANSHVRNVTIRDNNIYSGDIESSNFGALNTGINIYGVDEVYCYNNTVRNGYVGINISACRDVQCYENSLTDTIGTALTAQNQIQIVGVHDGFITNNNILNASDSIHPEFGTGILEYEMIMGVSASGTTLTNRPVTVANVFFEHYKSLSLTVNNTSYTFSNTWTNFTTMDTTVSVGTLPQSSFAPAAVNTSTDIINIPSHGFITGAQAALTSSGTLPAHTAPTLDPVWGLSIYYVIRVDANNIKLTSTLLSAVTGTPYIDFTSQGTGTHTITPILRSKFSNNIYRDNIDIDGIALETTGTSQIIVTNAVDVQSLALHCDRTYHQHANHGTFWNPAVSAFGLFMWEAWICPEAGAEYFISDDYGGAHNLLWGCGGMTNGYGSITGNIWLNGGTVSFASLDGFYVGEWHHVAVGWDGAFIYTWVDGVLSKKTAASGTRNTLGVGIGGILFVGGSDHSNYAGYVRYIRGFEGWFPWSINLATSYRPEHAFKNTYLDSTINGLQVGASFLADYSQSVNIIPDLSDGFSNGIRQVETQTVVAASGVTGNGNAKSVVTANGMIGSPVTVTIPVTTALTTASLIAATFRSALLSDPNVSRFFIIGGTGANIVLTAIEPQDNDSTANFTVEKGTSTGITDNTTSTNTTAGYQGKLIKHPGYLASELDGSNTGNFDGGNPPSGRISNIATFKPVNFVQPTVFHGTPLTIPSGAIVYDDFSRANVTWAWSDTLTPGTARTGQTPTVPQADVGIVDGCAFNTATSSGIGLFGAGYGHCIYTIGSSTQDVRMSRKTTETIGGYGLLLRWTDNDNYIQWSSSPGGVGQVVEKVGGAVAGLASGVMSSFTSVRFTVTGTTVKVFEDGSGTPTFTATTSIVSGTKAGFAVGGYGRVEEFSAY